jgi:hypothetical protein
MTLGAIRAGRHVLPEQTLLAHVLRFLVQHPGVCSADIGATCYPSYPRQQQQTKVGNVLRLAESRGLATRNPVSKYEVGSKHGHARGIPLGYAAGDGLKKPQPSHLWWITTNGTELLARLSELPARRAESSAAARVEADAVLELATRRQALLANAKRGGGVSTSYWERRLAVPELRAAGISLREIGEVFGVSREQIRQDLTRLAEWGQPMSPRHPISGPGRRRAVNARRVCPVCCSML